MSTIWSRGNVLASRSKVPTEVNGFFQDLKILSTSPPGGTLSWGSESEISGSLKNLKPEKIGLWAKFNRHIHVLVIPKFGGAQYILKCRSSLGSNDHSIKYNTIRQLLKFILITTLFCNSLLKTLFAFSTWKV